MANIKHLVLFLILGSVLAQPGTHGEKRRREGHDPLSKPTGASSNHAFSSVEQSEPTTHAPSVTHDGLDCGKIQKAGRPSGHIGAIHHFHTARDHIKNRDTVARFRASHATSQVRLPQPSTAKRAASEARGERPPARIVPIPLHYLLFTATLSPDSRHLTTMHHCPYRATSTRSVWSVCSSSRFSPLLSAAHIHPPSPSSLLQHAAVTPHPPAAAAPMTTQVRGVPKAMGRERSSRRATPVRRGPRRSSACRVQLPRHSLIP
jgi:hypothetical protein